MISDLEREVARLRAENARLLRLLELTPRQASPPAAAQTGLFHEFCRTGTAGLGRDRADERSRPRWQLPE